MYCIICSMADGISVYDITHHMGMGGWWWSGPSVRYASHGGIKMIKISVNLHKIVFSLYEHCLYTYGFLAAA